MRAAAVGRHTHAAGFLPNKKRLPKEGNQRKDPPLCCPYGVNLGRGLELDGSQTRTIRPGSAPRRPRAQTRSPQLPPIQAPARGSPEGDLKAKPPPHPYPSPTRGEGTKNTTPPSLDGRGQGRVKVFWAFEFSRLCRRSLELAGGTARRSLSEPRSLMESNKSRASSAPPARKLQAKGSRRPA